MQRLQIQVFGGLLALAVAVTPIGALAQSAPSDMPSYASPATAGPAAPSDQETIHGNIASVDAADSLQVNDDRGFVDSVQLQAGTVINPGGAQLQPGMTVTIAGVARGSVFAANRIDIADAMSGPPPQQAGMAPPMPPAMGPPPPQSAPGAVLTGSLGMSLDSKHSFVGENVVLTNVSSVDGAIAGATLSGTVTDVTPPGQGRNAQVRIHFDSLRMSDGTTSHIDGIVVAMKVKTKSNAAKEIGGAFLGMLAGNAIGKTLFGVSGGGLVGAVGGFMIAKDNRSDVVIPAESAVTVQLVNPRRQAS
jgi:hypothetical protein